MNSEEKVISQEQQKAVTIIVNGRSKEVTARELSFAQIVALAFGNVAGDVNTIFTVTYRNGEGKKPEGTLVAGEEVKIKKGMIFNVIRTSKS